MSLLRVSVVLDDLKVTTLTVSDSEFACDDLYKPLRLSSSEGALSAQYTGFRVSLLVV
jgi:hypothetical protein